MVASPREPSDVYFADNFADDHASYDDDDHADATSLQPFATSNPICLVQCQQWVNSHLNMAGFLSSKQQGVSVLKEAPDAAAATLNILHKLLLQRQADADTKAALQGQLSKHRMDADCAHKKVERLEGDIEQQHTSNASLIIKVRKLGDQGKAKDAVWLQKQQESVREVSRLKSAVASQERDARKSERETADLRTQLQRRVFGSAAVNTTGGGSSCSPPRGSAGTHDGSITSNGRAPVFARGSSPAQQDVSGPPGGLVKTRPTSDDAQRLIQESRKAENEQLKAQVLALNGELLQVRMQLSGSLPAAAPQHLKASIRTTSGANVELFGSAVDASVSESARLEALARAADLKALQLCAEQLKGAVQRLSEKEQLLAMSRRALAASDALVATKNNEAVASAQKAASQQRLLKTLQGRLAVLGSDRESERASTQRSAAAMVQELRNLQMDLDISLQQCTAADEEVTQGRSRVSELESVNDELRSQLDRSRRQQQHGREREQSSQQRVQTQRQQQMQEEIHFTTGHGSPSYTSSDSNSQHPPQLNANPDVDASRPRNPKHNLRASMTCLPNPLFSSPYSSSNTPFSALNASSTENTKQQPVTTTSGTARLALTPPPAYPVLFTDETPPAQQSHHTATTAAAAGIAHPLASSFSNPMPTLHRSSYGLETSSSARHPAIHPLSSSTSQPSPPPLQHTTFTRSLLYDRPVSHSLNLLQVSHSGASGCLSASGRRMWDVQDPLTHPHVTPRQLLIDEDLADTADSRGSFNSITSNGSSVTGEGQCAGDKGMDYSRDGYAAQEVEEGNSEELADGSCRVHI